MGSFIFLGKEKARQSRTGSEKKTVIPAKAGI
jgi:hypothetical protein